MFVAAHEWTLPPEQPREAVHESSTRRLYQRLAGGEGGQTAKSESLAFLQQALRRADSTCSLPESPHELAAWMRDSAQQTGRSYRAYLEARKAGEPRRYFSNRAHALHFLRAAAPTKLVDGAWLYGLLAQRRNPRLDGLVATYAEELGEGRADKNHVLLYRRLLARHGLNPLPDLPDGFYTQGALQLALGAHAGEFLPEVVGFNLGYEQLPLHLLITACELDELGIDPYYFTLHVTVDNADSGHAQRAVQAVLDLLPQRGDRAAFWQRVRNGSRLADAGIGTTAMIAGFDIDREIETIFSRKRVTGQGMHSDHCRLAGRNINDWLAGNGGMAGFVAALEQTGWIRRGAPANESRFWRLLQGEQAQMFGVFSRYELQVIHDWIRGNASADGQAHDEPPLPAGRRRATFRAQSRLARQRPGGMPRHGEPRMVHDAADEMPDPDLQSLQAELAATGDAGQNEYLLIEAMSPWMHWTPAGLYATRQFLKLDA